MYLAFAQSIGNEGQKMIRSEEKWMTRSSSLTLANTVRIERSEFSVQKI